ncbi:two-partner secretion domain-containing protein [Magnetococcales bacterium HHB-1]
MILSHKARSVSRIMLLKAAKLERACFALILFFFVRTTHALPTLTTDVTGTAAVTNPDANTLTITETVTTRPIYEWNSIDTTATETINFVLPSTSSMVLNRVTGGSATSFFGSINANGRVVILNPNGITFESGSTIDVAALIASTASITDANFQSGTLSFTGATADSQVINKGSIIADANEYVTLAAPYVENSGTITLSDTTNATTGRVVLASAEAFVIQENENTLLNFITDPGATLNSTQARTIHSGTITVQGGGVLITNHLMDSIVDSTVSMGGVIEAQSVAVADGRIYLHGGSNGTTNVTGTITATNQDASTGGGTVRITGKTVNIGGSATINTTGESDGGEISVGTNISDNTSRYASTVAVNSSSVNILSNATAGAGGTQVFRSSGDLTVAGTVQAQGTTSNGSITLDAGGAITVSSALSNIDTLSLQNSTGITFSNTVDISTLNLANSSATTKFENTTTLSAVIDDGGATIDVDTTQNFTVNGAITSLGALTVTNSDTSLFGGAVTISTLTLKNSNNINFNGNVSTNTFTAEAGSYNLSFLGSNSDFNGGLNTNSVIGTVTFQNNISTNNNAIVINSATISPNTSFNAGTSSITFNGTATLSDNANLTLQTAGSGTVALNNITATNSSSLININSGGEITVSGVTNAQGTLVINSGNNATFSGSTEISTLNLTNSSATTKFENTTTLGAVVDDGGATIDIDTTQSFTANGAITSLGTLTVTNSDTSLFNGAITISTLTLKNSNNINFNSDISTNTFAAENGSYNLSFLGSNSLFNGGLDTTRVTGTVTLQNNINTDNNAIAIGNATISSDAAFNAGTSSITFSGTTTLNADLALTTDNSSGGDVTLGNISASGSNMTVNTGGNLSVSGSVSTLNALTISSVNNATFSNSVTVSSLTIKNGKNFYFNGNLSANTFTAEAGSYNLSFLGSNSLFNGGLDTTSVTGMVTLQNNINTDNNAIAIGNATISSDAAFNAGTSSITFSGTTTLSSNVNLALTTDSNSGGGVTLGTVNADGSSNMAVNMGGNLSVSGNISTLNAFAINSDNNSAGDVEFQKTVKIQGEFTYTGSGNVTLNENFSTQGGNIHFGNSTVYVTKDLDIDSNGGDITITKLTTLGNGLDGIHPRILADTNEEIAGGTITAGVDVWDLTLSGLGGAITGRINSAYTDPTGRLAAERIETIPAPHGGFTFNGLVVPGTATEEPAPYQATVHSIVETARVEVAGRVLDTSKNPYIYKQVSDYLANHRISFQNALLTAKAQRDIADKIWEVFPKQGTKTKWKVAILADAGEKSSYIKTPKGFWGEELPSAKVDTKEMKKLLEGLDFKIIHLTTEARDLTLFASSGKDENSDKGDVNTGKPHKNVLIGYIKALFDTKRINESKPDKQQGVYMPPHELVIFFSGHGVLHQGGGLLSSYDSGVKESSLSSDKANFDLDRLISFEEISQAIRTGDHATDSRILIVTDSCYPGEFSLIDDKNKTIEEIKQTETNKNRPMIAMMSATSRYNPSLSSLETVKEEEGSPPSLFTRTLTSFLKNKKKISSIRAANLTQNSIKGTLFFQDNQIQSQTPQYHQRDLKSHEKINPKEIKTDFFFIK